MPFQIPTGGHPGSQQPRKIHLLLLTGGASSEHAVSLSSARSVLPILQANPDITCTLAVITTSGSWLDEPSSHAALISPGSAREGGQHPLDCAAARLRDVDVVFPLMHGTTGEDGVVQGFLEMVGMPYVGCGVGASAACMDKTVTKAILAAAGLPVVPAVNVSRVEFEADEDECVERIVTTVKGPWIVKPASLGSSVGVERVGEQEFLRKALEKAFVLDGKALVEQFLIDAWEIEVGVIGPTHNSQVSVAGRIEFGSIGFYDHEKKYTEGQAQLHIPADVPEGVSETCRKHAKKAYEVLECCGLSRVDFLCNKESGVCFVNEVNTMPGMTPTSMFIKLWEASGLTKEKLVQEILDNVNRRRKV